MNSNSPGRRRPASNGNSDPSVPTTAVTADQSSTCRPGLPRQTTYSGSPLFAGGCRQPLTGRRPHMSKRKPKADGRCSTASLARPVVPTLAPILLTSYRPGYQIGTSTMRLASRLALLFLIFCLPATSSFARDDKMERPFGGPPPSTGVKPFEPVTPLIGTEIREGGATSSSNPTVAPYCRNSPPNCDPGCEVNATENVCVPKLSPKILTPYIRAR